MKDFTQPVLTEHEIRNIIGRILSDGVIVRRPYTILSIGTDISNILGASVAELIGGPLSNLMGPEFSADDLRDLLRMGYFEGHETSLRTRAGVSTPCILSGFYLNLIAGASDLVILKFRFRSNLEDVLKQLQAKTEEMDDFIYAAAHDLRGPLATLKGLINLMKIPGRKNYKFISEKMSLFAERLDDRLYKLIYFAESDKESEVSGELTLIEIIEGLGLSGEGFNRLSSVILRSDVLPPVLLLENGKLVLALLANIKSFLLRHSSGRRDIDLQVEVKDASCEFSMTMDGIEIAADRQRKIESLGFGYAGILSEPQFADLYSAKKIALKLQGDLRMQITGGKVSIQMSIPRI